MICLIQRVSSASVSVAGEEVAAINRGLMVLTGIQRDDDEPAIAGMAARLLDYRIFADGQGRMNLSLRDVQGALLLVPNFTLAADTRKGLRPGFDSAAPPARAAALYERLVDEAKSRYADVYSGVFGADMQVQLINDGPVTFSLSS